MTKDNTVPTRTREKRQKISCHELAFNPNAPHELGEFLDSLLRIHGTKTISVFQVGLKLFGLVEQTIDVERERERNAEDKAKDAASPRYTIDVTLENTEGEPIPPGRLVRDMVSTVHGLTIYGSPSDADDAEESGYRVVDAKVTPKLRDHR
jgi:hypothetical protein